MHTSIRGSFPALTCGILALGLNLILPAPTSAQVAPELSVVGGFFAGAARRKMQQLQSNSLHDLRDGLRWQDVEQGLGVYQFNTRSGAYLSELDERLLLGTILLQPQSPLYAQAKTVTKAEDLDAFAKYARAVADHFPQTMIEVANEFNGSTFVSGKARAWTTARRAKLHAETLEKIANAGVPRARIIGGAMHSMAGGYLWPMLDAGAAAHMGAVAVHPYTTAPEAFPRQLAILREHPEMAKLHVDVTEFGTRDTNNAADYFWRYYCQMARAGVRRAFWYPLDPRKDGYVPVLDAKRRLTPVGRAVVFATTTLAGQSVKPVQPDPYTYGCLFGERTLVLWGAERTVTLHRKDLLVRSADGRRHEGTLKLSRSRVLIISSTAPIDPTEDISFGTQSVLLDSFDQFTEEASAPFLTLNGQRLAFSICPGQDRPEAPWFPHLCTPKLPSAVLHDRGFSLPNGNVRFHFPFAMPQDAKVKAVVHYEVNKASVDGVEVLAKLNETEHSRLTLFGIGQEVFDLGTIERSTVIEVVLGTGPNAKGDRGKFRMQLIYD